MDDNSVTESVDLKNEATRQIVMGVLFILIVSFLLWPFLPRTDYILRTSQRILFAVEWMSLLALPFVVLTCVVSYQRFQDRKAIFGTSNYLNKSLVTNKKIAANTFEQTLIAMAVVLPLASLLPNIYLKVIPLIAFLFLVGRLLYWFTYRMNPMLRFTGFVIGFYPLVAALAVDLLLMGYKYWG